jgi:hypothetical protein
MATAVLRIPRRLILLLLALAALAVPASATIQFSYCSSGCSDNTGTGTYGAWKTATGSTGLTFSVSPLTFFAGGLDVNGVFTDTTGTVFTGYSNSSTTTTNSLTLNGTALAQTTNGKFSGIEITLPSNTYAFAMIISTVTGFGSPFVELNDLNLNAANFSLTVPNGGPAQFFGFLSDTPITSLFIGNLDNLSGKVQINSFELGELSSDTSAVPEGSSLGLMGGGLLLLGLLRRRGRIQKPDGIA